MTDMTFTSHSVKENSNEQRISSNFLGTSSDTNLRSVFCSFLWFQQSRVERVVGEAKGDSLLSLVVHRSTLKSTNTLADNLLWRLASKLFSSNPVITFFKPGVKLHVSYVHSSV